MSVECNAGYKSGLKCQPSVGETVCCDGVTLLQELTEEKHKLEYSVRDLTMKVSSLVGDNERLEADLATIRQDYSSLGSDRSEQEREMTHIRMNLAVLEQDAKMKDEQLMRVAEELSFEREAKVGARGFQIIVAIKNNMCTASYSKYISHTHVEQFATAPTTGHELCTFAA